MINHLEVGTATNNISKWPESSSAPIVVNFIVAVIIYLVIEKFIAMMEQEVMV